MKKQITLPGLIKKAQKVFNAFIRERDKDRSCITCGKYKIEHACHFYSAGQYPALRFNTDNVHGGCLSCNYFKHGELHFYRDHLEKRIGKDRLALLDSTATRNRVRKWSRVDLGLIISIYSNGKK